MTDSEYMKLALQAASAVEGRTWPNPMVGAVVVNNGRIVGMGAHLKAGEPHAEVHALRMADEHAKGGTLYVTLEPCSHYGKTPPCADRVIEAGISHVVIAMLDPNPLVAGRGVELLKNAQIKVEIGVMEQEAKKMNEVWLTYIQKKRPFVWAKAAMTLDGKIAAATGDSKWITSPDARLEVHRMRNQVNAILVGIGTVLADDPQLTTRLPEGGRNPARVVLDTHLRIPFSAKVLDDSAATLIVCGMDVDQTKLGLLQEAGAEVIQLQPIHEKIPLDELLTELYKRNVTLLFVEGGGEVHGSFLHAGFIDKLTMFIAPKLIGGTGPSPIMGTGFSNMANAIMLREMSIKKIGADFAITGYPEWKGSE